MGYGLWQRLVRWEVRHALRGKLFWVMAAAVALLPWLLAPEVGLPSPRASTVAVTQTAVTYFVALWIVFAVRRQLDKEVSDDWLLVLQYRQSLASRFVAGAVLGLVMVAAAVVSLWSNGVLLDATDVGLITGLLCVSLLQPLAVAALVVAAADFMLAAMPLVLFVVTVLALGSAVVPVFGFAVPLAKLLEAEPAAAAWGSLLLVADLVVCTLLLGLAWRKAEDFWAYLKLAKARQEYAAASLGELRGAVQQQAAQRRQGDHSGTSHLREHWRQRGWEPLWAFDLARYPAWVRPRREHAWVGLLVGVGLLYTVLYAAAVESNVLTFVNYFGWWTLAVTTVLRVLVSAAGIVVQEKEQGTLAALLVTPHSARRILWVKLAVVLRQALPALMVLLIWKALWLRGLEAEVVIALLTLVVSAAVGGIVSSALAGSRLLATILAFAAAAAIFIAPCRAIDPVYRHVIEPLFWAGGLSQRYLGDSLRVAVVMLLPVVLIGALAIRPCARLLYRQAA